MERRNRKKLSGRSSGQFFKAPLRAWLSHLWVRLSLFGCAFLVRNHTIYLNPLEFFSDIPFCCQGVGRFLDKKKGGLCLP